eukprot:CAMPEP_0195087410 /NCGR_PEP_ID=MMETSP0448-20130528/27257_1 /TAXON_ID=66468 /ORGANISM="Heterocapsa triquestra, Strain CCMP 448" /LENGTH=49 /DNA_ID= /DNA_START= /DNA_END= /DNA_ORIENTATION=
MAFRMSEHCVHPLISSLVFQGAARGASLNRRRALKPRAMPAPPAVAIEP